MKKKGLLIVVNLLFLASFVYSQQMQNSNSNPIDSAFVNTIKTKYAVPDAPAFNILNEVPGDILKPTSVKEMAVSFANFLGENEKITLPRSFAVEFSPGLLIAGKNMTIDDYTKKSLLRNLMRLRVSLATERDTSTGSVSSLAIGLRGTIIDESDLRMNPEYIKAATKLAEKLIEIETEIRVNPQIEATMTEVEKAELEKKRKEAAEKKEDLIKEFTEEGINKWSEEKWNATIVEWALAFRADSQDSLAENLKFSKVAAWLSGSWGIQSWGQWMLGVNGFYEKLPDVNKYKSNLSLASRFYVGMNKLKVFIHLQGVGQESQEPMWVVNSGMEIKVSEGLWAEFDGGIQYGEDTDNGKFITDFKLKYGL